ncbi:MAG: hypothetical protein M0002_17675 [Rhodospirillales bacterium]|nr:hypothetical protein [Rhodospirillales bacterium]
MPGLCPASRRPHLVIAALAALLLAAWTTPARADGQSSPMSFTLVATGPGGLFSGILAEGVIESDTPAIFKQFLAAGLPPVIRGSKVFLLSPGGDLQAGMALGRAIRAAGLATEVGLPGQPEGNIPSSLFGQPGGNASIPILGPDTRSYCASACTFAFLGGIARSAAPGSIYAVHRFFLAHVKPGTITLTDPTAILRQGQITAGDLVAYIHAMGVSPELYKLMTEGNRNKTVDLTQAEMATLRVTTHEVVSAHMLYPPNGLPILVIRDENGGIQYGRMDLFCTFHHQLLDRAYFGAVSSVPAAPAVTLKIIPAAGGQPLEASVPPGSYNVGALAGGRLPIDVYIPPGPIFRAVQDAAGIVITAVGPGLSIGQVPISDQVGGGALSIPPGVQSRLAALVRGC